MNNYEYIIASLPVLDESRPSDKSQFDVEDTIAQIRSQLSGKDVKILDLVLSNYAPEGPDADFYAKALKSGNAFVREYFKFDLGVRNAKVEYLNRTLGRPEGKDMIPYPEDDFEGKAKADEILSGNDILARERGLDDMMWSCAEELTQMHVFDLDVILSFVVRMKTIGRWMRLDDATGREMFRKLVDELRNSKNI